MGRKGDVEMDAMIYIIIGIFVLTAIVTLIVILKGKGSGALQYIKELFRFGR